MNNICFSGGAKGADEFFGEIAKKLNHEIIHYSFKGHKSVDFKNTEILRNSDLKIADNYLIDANKILKRKFPTSSDFVNNLLRRNYYQIVESNNLYAIAEIKNNIVQGGTSWSVEMFKQNRKGNIFVFDKMKNHWTKWDGVCYKEIKEIPIPSGFWTGIGSREITIENKNIILKSFKLKE